MTFKNLYLVNLFLSENLNFYEDNIYNILNKFPKKNKSMHVLI